jgi:hypothetical protein
LKYLPEKHVEHEKEGGWVIGYNEFELENEEPMQTL